MASIVSFPHDPRYRPGIESAEEEGAFIDKYLTGVKSIGPEERHDPDEVPKRALVYRGNHKTIPDFVAVHARLAVCPEARALIEEFEPGVHQFLPVEIVRKRGKRPIHRLDGRVLDEPYYVFIPQTFLDAVWIERSSVQVTATYHGPPLVVPHLGSDNIVLRREVAAEHHVWRGAFHLPGRVFFSDALARAVQARKLRKLECVHLGEA